MFDEAVVEAEESAPMQYDPGTYLEWLRREVELGRMEIRAGLGIPDEQVRAEFAARRKQARTQAALA